VHRLVIAYALVAAPAAGLAQTPDLAEAADRARAAWFAHDAASLVANSPRLLIQLPGADPSVALGRAQAAALLADFVAPAQEVETTVRAAREVEPGRGYVELQRQYSVTGTQNVRIQILLLGYRLEETGWSLVEIRVAA
jgi:hypothetical protein